MDARLVSTSSNHDMTAKTVLLVEDEFLIARREQAILENQGMTVLTAADGKTAVEIALTAPTLDLILMDIDLGSDIDGTEAARQILAQRDLPIVFFSSHTSPEIVEKTENITAYGYIVKNSGETVLLASIKMAFKLFDAHQRLKQQEEALRESNALFQTQFELGNIGITIASPDKAWLHVNQRLCDLLGYSEAELKQTTWSALTHPDDVAADVAQFERMRAGEIDRYELEKRFIRKDGTILSAHLAAACYRNPDHSIRFTIGSIQDISNYKKTELQLAETIQRLTTHIDNSPLAVIEFDPEFHVISWSNGAERLFGWTAAEIIGRSIAEMRWVHVEDIELINKACVGFLSGECSRSLNVNRNYRKDGAMMYCEWYNSAIYDAQGKLISVLSQVLDITERKQAEEALLRSEAQFRSFMDNSPAIAWAKDEQGRHIYLSRTCEKQFNVKFEDCQGKTDFKLWPPDIADAFWKNDQIVLASDQPIQVEEETRKPDGTRCFWLNFKFPFYDVMGRKCIGGIGIDVTDYKRANETLQQKEQQLRKLNAQKDTFFPLSRMI